jgi:hypothetical protein
MPWVTVNKKHVEQMARKGDAAYKAVLSCIKKLEAANIKYEVSTDSMSVELRPLALQADVDRAYADGVHNDN